MKISFLFLFVGILHLSASGYAQNKRLDMQVENVTLKEILKNIESQTEFTFFYVSTEVDVSQKVTGTFKNARVTDVLDQMLMGKGIGYRVRDKQILLYKQSKYGPAAEKAQQITVTGTITDKEGLPMPGVNVVVKGTTNGVVTGADGKYKISVPNRNTAVVVTFVGYTTQEIIIGDRSVIDIILEESTQEIEEIVVVGYGTQRKASVVGAIQTIAPADLQVSSRKNISNSLAGKLSGVIAVTRSGEPGYDQSNFWIRGISSFSGTTSPLVLVDGIQRTLDDLDISEIESFSILKDAAASAVYGVRGANGVILVNTRRGKVQKPEVSLRVEHAVTSPTRMPEFIGAADHMQLLNDLAAGEKKVAYFTQEAIDKTRSGYDPELYPDVSWIDAIARDMSNSTRADVNVNGGTEMIRYNLTAAMYNERGIMKVDETLPYDTGTKLTRYNLRANVDLDITKTTSMRFSVGGYLQKLRKQDKSTDETWDFAFQTPPMVHPAIYADGKIPVRNSRQNPWAFLTQYGYNIGTKSKIESLFAVEQKLDVITEGLSTKVSFSFDNYSMSTLKRSKSPTYYLPATTRNDEGELVLTQHSTGSEFLNYENSGEYGNNQTYLEWALNYDRTLYKDHRVSALLLYNQRSYDNGGIQDYRNQGFAGRFSYSYQNKYIGEFNFGYNGSENFASGNRFGFFPSVALGWIVSSEKFWTPVKETVSHLKVRVSWGKAGNDQIGSDRRFGYITTMNAKNGSYKWGNTGNESWDGVTEGDVGVSNLTWETVTKKNIGLEIGLWNRINIQADIFSEFREDIFMQRRTIPTQTGFMSTPYANFGEVKNNGGEIAVSYSDRIGLVAFNIYTNVTYARNKILEYDVPVGTQGTHQDITDHSINELYGYQAIGLYTESDFNADGTLLASLPQNELATVRPGDIKYMDWNGDGVINSRDEGYIGGTKDPRLVYGFGGGLSVKGFDFSFFIQGVGDTYRIIGGQEYFISGSGQGIRGNIFTNYNDRWTEDNQSQDVFWPRLSYATNYNNSPGSTWWKKDMSFFRLKQVELGYTLPKTAVGFLKNTRFYINGNNLLTFSGFKLWDPELDTSTGCKYPSVKSVLFGVEVIF